MIAQFLFQIIAVHIMLSDENPAASNTISLPPLYQSLFYPYYQHFMSPNYQPAFASYQRDKVLTLANFPFDATYNRGSLISFRQHYPFSYIQPGSSSYHAIYHQYFRNPFTFSCKNNTLL